MRTGLLVFLAVIVGAGMAYALQKHVQADCSPWLANLKICGAVISK